MSPLHADSWCRAGDRAELYGGDRRTLASATRARRMSPRTGPSRSASCWERAHEPDDRLKASTDCDDRSVNDGAPPLADEDRCRPTTTERTLSCLWPRASMCDRTTPECL